MKRKQEKIPVIDIFAGPGGLGEGFSANANGSAFDIRLSIEKDINAHSTLELRSFIRQFEPNKIPEEYYAVIRESKLDERGRLKRQLFERFPEAYAHARKEAWQCTLGQEDPLEVNRRIKGALNGAKDWVLIGGPPCQAYSVVGRSRRQEGEGLNPDDHRVHLYKEYLRIIAAHHPSVFVMENVKGLLSARVDGIKIFDLIRKDLANPNRVFPKSSSPSYKIYSLVVKPESGSNEKQPVYKKDSDFLIKAEDYGIPQKRHRVILLGIRADIDAKPDVLKPSDRISLKNVISDLPALRSGINRSFVRSEMVETEDGRTKTKRIYKNESDSQELWQELVRRFRSEIVQLNGFAGNTGEKELEALTTGNEFVPCSTPATDNPLFDWYKDDRLDGIANHESRSHLKQDLKRYLFAAMYTEKYEKFPRMKDYALHSRELLPDHENAESGKFADRFRVQLPDEPATTVTSHISKDGHYFIHYDPVQCRSFTVREAARVQTFPDNYLFCGSRTAQYHQVGNAVPPYLARQIGEVVSKIFDQLKD